MKRGLIIGGVVVVAAIAVVVVVVLTQGGSIIKAAVEEVGPQITKTRVTLKDADVSITSGEGALRGLVIGNPQGYKTDAAFRLGEIKVKVDMGSLASDTILVKEIVIAAPDITYELGGSAGDNIRAISNNAQQFAGGGGAEPAQPAAKDETSGKKLIIENLWIRDGKIAVSATALGGKKLGASLPTIHLTDIGKDKGGASPGEVAEKVLGALNASVQKAVADIGLDKLKGAAGAGAEELKKKLEGGGGVGGAVGGAAEGVGSSMKKLLGR